MSTAWEMTARPASAGLWRAELRAMLALALPLALTQLGQLLIHSTEVLFLARLSPEKLASATLAWSLFQPAFMIAIGIVQATAPLIAQARGANDLRAVRRAVRQGLWVSLCLILPMGLLLWNAKPFFMMTGQDPALLEDTMTYLRAGLWGLPFGAGFVVLRCFVSAFDKTRAVLLITGMAILLNIVLSYALIFGRLGLPPLGILGAGIGASVSWAFMFLALLVYCLRQRVFRRFAILGRFWVPDWKSFWEIWRLGLPIAGAFLMETSIFAAATLMMGRMGAIDLAAHQVTMQITATSFMVPLGIGIAATIRIGLAAGRRDANAVRRAGWTATALGFSFMAAMALLFWLGGAPLIGLFFDAGANDAERAMGLALGFLHIAAFFQLFDALQTIGIASLRGLRDTAIPMWLAALGYWGIGLPASFILGFQTDLGGRGIWIGLAMALGAVAIAMTLRFLLLTKRPRLQARLDRLPLRAAAARPR